MARERVVGVDVARCLALLGMMATHILPGVVDGEVTLAQQIAGGRSSALFAVLAGVSLVLVARTTGPLLGRAWWGFATATLVRSVLLGGLGLALGDLPTHIAVILAYYAVLFVLAAPFLRLTTPTLLWVTGGWLLLAPVLSQALRSWLPATRYEVPSTASLADPVSLLRDLLVTGFYPALTWLGYLLVGVLVARTCLRTDRAALGLVVGGSAAMVVALVGSGRLVAQDSVRAALVRSFSGSGWLGDLDTTLQHGLYGTTPTGSWWWLGVAAPHSGTTFDLVATSGSAVAVLGLGLLLGRAMGRSVGVVFGAGAMTLTLYSLHVLSRAEDLWSSADLSTYLWQVGIVMTVGALYALAGRRGPLEAVLGVIGSGVRRVVGGRGS